jgi:hypothetical protein
MTLCSNAYVFSRGPLVERRHTFICEKDVWKYSYSYMHIHYLRIPCTVPSYIYINMYLHIYIYMYKCTHLYLILHKSKYKCMYIHYLPVAAACNMRPHRGSNHGNVEPSRTLNREPVSTTPWYFTISNLYVFSLDICTCVFIFVANKIITHVYVLCIKTDVYVDICICHHVHTCIHILYRRTYTSICICICMYIYMNTYKYVYVYLNVYINMCIHVYIHIHVYIYKYICVYIYILYIHLHLITFRIGGHAASISHIDHYPLNT